MSEPEKKPGDDGAALKALQTQVDDEAARRKVLESDLQAACDALLSEVPENLKALIPEGLGAAERIKWFQNAKKTGVFGAGVKVPETDTGKPATTPKDVDLSKLPPVARMAHGYKKGA